MLPVDRSDSGRDVKVRTDVALAQRKEVTHKTRACATVIMGKRCVAAGCYNTVEEGVRLVRFPKTTNKDESERNNLQVKIAGNPK